MDRISCLDNRKLWVQIINRLFNIIYNKDIVINNNLIQAISRNNSKYIWIKKWNKISAIKFKKYWKERAQKIIILKMRICHK